MHRSTDHEAIVTATFFDSSFLGQIAGRLRWPHILTSPMMLFSGEDMFPASPLHRHQSSLEGIMDFSAKASLVLGPDQRRQARSRFYRIVEYFEVSDGSGDNTSRNVRPRLVRFTYEYALSEESRDHFLRFFFRATELSMEDEVDIDFECLSLAFFGCADYLLDNFFIPLKASSKKTAQPFPSYPSVFEGLLQGEGQQGCVGTSDQVLALREACLTRDRHRCVISRRFDYNEALKRFRGSNEARDDEGNLLRDDEKPFESLEVAHILPHSLTKVNAEGRLRSALAILNMFDHGVTSLLEGMNMDEPRNAITLTPTLHQAFGNFDIFFEATESPHTYLINSFLPHGFIRDPPIPVFRTLYLTDDRIIDPPLPRLLAIHRAIAHILYLSGAGKYIDKLLEDMEQKGILVDDSTDFPRLLELGLGGWLDETIST